ncbi:MmpL protein [Mycobacterium basiliense]
MPIQRPEGTDSEAATEQLNARGGKGAENGAENPRQRRRGAGGLSAQDLLRREGRL